MNTQREEVGPAAPDAVTPKGKLGALVALLLRPEGASLDVMQAATGWQAHSVRGAIAGSIKKKLDFAVTSEKSEAGRVYRIVKGGLQHDLQHGPADAERASLLRPIRARGEGARLEGLVFDDRNNPMVAVHTKRGMTRYRYYLSRAKLTRKGEAGSLHRISAGVLERFLGERLVPMFSPAWRPNPEDVERVTPAIRRVTLSENQLVVHVAEEAISPELLDVADVTRLEDGVCSIRLAFHLRRRQGALILEAADAAAAPAARVDRALLRAMALARVWATQLESGEVSSVKELARQNGLCHNYTARLLPLAYLAPDLTEAVLQGAQPRSVSLAGLTAQPLPWDWSEQRRRFAAIG